MECKQSKNLPPLVMDSQMVVCPNCKHYWRGECNNAARTTDDGPCPFDGKELPLREATLEDGKSPDDIIGKTVRMTEAFKKTLSEANHGISREHIEEFGDVR